MSIHPSQVRGRGHGVRRRASPLLEREWTEPLPILAWAIEHPEGLIVVDTGETARTAEPGYLPHRFPDDFDPEPIAWSNEPVGSFERSLAITAAGDVVAVPTPGHTPGHLSVLVRDTERQFLITGDVGYTEALIAEGAIDGVAGNEQAAARTLANVADLTRSAPTVVLPTHDPESERRLGSADTETSPR